MNSQVKKYTLATAVVLFVTVGACFFLSKIPVSTDPGKSPEKVELAMVTNTNLKTIPNPENQIAEKEVEEKEIVVVDHNQKIRELIKKLNREISTIRKSVKVYKKMCLATYYHSMFNGRLAADGSVFSNKELTAAHKKLKFGTIVRVTNTENNKSVVVKITDRGPFVKNKEIDLTRRAFGLIGPIRKGNLKVKLEILPKDYKRINTLLKQRDKLINDHFGTLTDSLKQVLKRIL